MTNAAIIEGIARSIFGDDEVDAMIASGTEIPLHTVKGWNNRGQYRIKKGEHGIETKLWKRRDKNNAEGEGADQGFYLAKAYLFTKNQVEKAD